jgi:hypothetical protein
MSMVVLSIAIFTTKGLYSKKIHLHVDNIEIQRVLVFLVILLPLLSKTSTNLIA